MTACRLQSPNWWRTARDALAAAWALLDDASGPELAASAADGRVAEDDTGDRVQRAVAAIRWAIEAAVALRLPYGALQPAQAWAAGWRKVCRSHTANAGDSDGVVARCRAVFTTAGARCRRDGCPPIQLAAALDHAERALAVCYTERRSHR